MKQLGRVLLLVIGLGAGHGALAQEQCDEQAGIRMSGPEDAPWIIQFKFSPQEVPLNAPFDGVITICTGNEALPVRISVDATMPAHQHGMNYEPRVVQMDGRRYEVKNLVFHMPGAWLLEVVAYENEVPYRFTYEVKL